jgi:manganese transport protein
VVDHARTRLLAIVPSIFVVAWYGNRGMGALLLFSQVILSAQLSFAVIPLVQFTSDRTKMGEFVNGTVTRWIGWGLAALIAGLNAYLIVTALK